MDCDFCHHLAFRISNNIIWHADSTSHHVLSFGGVAIIRLNSIGPTQSGQPTILDVDCLRPKPQNGCQYISAGANTGADAGTDRAMASRVEALEALVKRVVEADKTTDDTGTTDTAMFVDVVREDVNLDVPSARTPGPDDDDDTGRVVSMAMPGSLSRDQQADEYHGDGFQDTLDEFMVRPSDDQIDLNVITEEPSEREIPQQHSYQLLQSDSSLTTTRKRHIDPDQQHDGRLTQTHTDQEGFDVDSSSLWPPLAIHGSRTQIPVASGPHPEHRDRSGGGGLRIVERQSQSRHVVFGAGSGNGAEQVRVGRSDPNLGLDHYQRGGTDLGSHHHPARSGGSSSPSSEGELGDGTLVISASGRSKYVGPTAGSEWLVDVSCSQTGP